MKRLMLGNEAVARGLYEAGCHVISSYPGTPSTEITEYAAEYDEMYAEWAPNEKVAAEVAIGAAIGGARSFCAMKHVGLNVAADPIFTASYTGINGGMIIAVADDQGMHSSQNEQDSRHYAIAAKLPMLEPADSSECRDYIKAAYEISEKFDTPVLLRLCTRVSHSQSIVEEEKRVEVPVKDYIKAPQKYVMMPGNAKGRHVVVEQRCKKLDAFAETTPLNIIEYTQGGGIGVITAGITHQYAKEALGDSVSYLKLGVINPLPIKLIKEFAGKVKTLYVLEELDDVIETHCKKNGISVIGKEIFSNIGEYSQKLIADKILGEQKEFVEYGETVPVRPPVMCPGCPHRGMFYTLAKMKLMVSGDIGCYTLGAAPPLAAMDTCICMGASISALHGFNKARNEENRSVAVIGDSTFIHSGITGLINITYNKGYSTVIIADNSITGMTGHQQNPTTGKTLKGDIVEQINIEKLCEAAGIKRVRVVDPNDTRALEETLKVELAVKEPSVIITRMPCALLKNVKHNPPLNISADKCKACKMCIKIGCPSISINGDKPCIDSTLCVGCGLCKSLCAFGAIEERGGAN